jgi:hypothetical protein
MASELSFVIVMMSRAMNRIDMAIARDFMVLPLFDLFNLGGNY